MITLPQFELGSSQSYRKGSKHLTLSSSNIAVGTNQIYSKKRPLRTGRLDTCLEGFQSLQKSNLFRRTASSVYHTT
jgi:hypothetical protein